MLLDTMRWIRLAGVDVTQVDVEPSFGDRTRVDAVLQLAAGTTAFRFAVEAKRRAPYPNELSNLEAQGSQLRTLGTPLLVAPFISEPLGLALVEAGWSWADTQGNFDLRAPNLVLRQRRTTKPPEVKRKTLPQGSGSLAIIRALIRFGEGEEEEGAATALAAQARVSQPRASQVLRRLNDLGLADKTGRGRWRPDREALLDRFLAEYAGPGGSEQFLYSLDSPTDVAIEAVRARKPHNRIVVSADVGPDLVTAWRRPSLVVLYVTQALDTEKLGLVDAKGRGDANVLVRSPEDMSVFPVPDFVAAVRGADVELADPSQMIWDLQDLGGVDRQEGAGMLREWLLTRP